MDFRIDLIFEYLPFFLRGAAYTIGISLLGIFLGLILGLFVGLGKMIKNRILSFPFTAYITFFRGTPLMLQILIIHFGVVRAVLGETNGVVAGITALTLNSAAYVAEIFRAGIQSLDKGQMEAARSLGMNYYQAMRHVILPQAFKRMIPPLGNEFIILLKDSAQISIIAVPELTYWARVFQGRYYKVWEPYLTAAFIYLVLTVVLTFLLDRLEKRLKEE